MADEERRLGDWLSSWAHKDAHAVCAPGLTPRLGLSTWPAMYPHRREMKQGPRCARIQIPGSRAVLCHCSAARPACQLRTRREGLGIERCPPHVYP
eukprot:2339209-Prymnesium_polylepis.1